MIDFKEIAAAALAEAKSLVPEIVPYGKVIGHEYRAGSLSGGNGESFSVNLNTGKWADFATSEKGGDLVSLYAAANNLSHLDAAKELGSRLGIVDDYAPVPRAPRKPPVAKKEEAAEWVQKLPPSKAPEIEHSRLGKPSRVWEYLTAEGALIGYVCRFDKPEGGKEYLPFSYGLDVKKNRERWAWKSFDDPRPLWNLPALVGNKKTVLVVEGEKAAAHAVALFPKLAVVTWAGGSKAVDKTDWKPLAGRQVAIWPDCDAKRVPLSKEEREAGVPEESKPLLEERQQPGIKAALKIGGILRGLGASVKFVRIPRPLEVEDGWDVADSDLTPETALPWIKARLVNDIASEPICAGPQDDVPPPDSYEGPEPSMPPEYEAAEMGRPMGFSSAPFRCVGFDKNAYYYFCRGKQQVVALSAAQHTTNNLLQIADRYYWQTHFAKPKSSSFDVEAATDSLMRGCEMAGIYDQDSIRGRGAWHDAGRIVVHLGDRVMIDGVATAPAEVQSRFIYEQQKAISADFSAPLCVSEANRVVKFMEMLAWDRPIMARLAAGWLVVAHVGGVLHWRPHIWVIGRKGSGKTWVMNNAIKALLGDNRLFIQGASTEAGIRGKLGVDSLPVLFDESEGETARAQENIQSILALVRGSSSDSGEILKGVVGGGGARTYAIRSAFAMSSINATMSEAADKSRITILELKKERQHIPFEQIQAVAEELCTSEFAERLYARSVLMADTIRKNAKVFSSAVLRVLDEQRAADQIGTLLAGCYALFSDKVIAIQAACDWVQAQDWTATREEIQQESDESKLWGLLMSSKIMVKLDSGSNEEITIGELIDIQRGMIEKPTLNRDSAKTVLRRHGFNPEINGVWVSNTHQHIRRVLAHTKASENWANILIRMEGAEKSDRVLSFGYTGSQARAVFIPYEI